MGHVTSFVNDLFHKKFCTTASGRYDRSKLGICKACRMFPNCVIVNLIWRADELVGVQV